MQESFKSLKIHYFYVLHLSRISNKNYKLASVSFTELMTRSQLHEFTREVKRK